MSMARRNMWAGKARTAFSIAGVAAATILLSFVIALYRGWNGALVRYIDETPADTWVVGTGADSFFTPSLIFSTTVFAVQQVQSVEQVSPLIGRPMKLRSGGSSWDSYVLGFEPGGAGGPVAMRKGKAIPDTGEIVIDDVLARLSGLDIGDEVRVGLRRLKVVGVSQGGNLVLAQISYVHIDEARLFAGDGVVNFILVRTTPGEAAAVRERINSTIAGVDAFDSTTFADNSREVLQRSILPILLVIVVLAVIVGTIVVGLTVYTAVIEKEREFGIMKAVGVSPPGIFRVVFEQSLVCGALGFAGGLVASFVLAWLAELTLPQVVTLFRWQDIALVAVAVAVMSLVAGAVPLQRLVHVDTLAVFKA